MTITEKRQFVDALQRYPVKTFEDSTDSDPKPQIQAMMVLDDAGALVDWTTVGGGGGGGDASAANQVTIIGHVDGIEALLTTISGLDFATQTTAAAILAAQLPDGHNVTVDNASIAITAAALPLPSGASTSALQTTGNSTLSTIAGLDFATQTTLASILSGQLADGHNVTVDNASIAVTAAALPLPSGAATSALQLPDGHNVTIDNSTGGSAVNIQDGGNSITVDGVVAATPGDAADWATALPTQTIVSVGTTSGVLIAADATRTGLLVRNRTNNNIYVSLSNGTATTNDYELDVRGQGFLIVGPNAERAYTAITSAASAKNVEVTEFFE